MRPPRVGSMVGILLLLLLAGQGLAQTSRPPAESGQEIYRVGRGDVIRVDVPGRTEMSGSFTVAEDGTITVPGLGNIRVQGRSATEIRSDLSRRVSLIDRSAPPVTVTVAEFKSRRVFVLGAVLLPPDLRLRGHADRVGRDRRGGGPLDDANLNSVEVIPGEGSQGGRPRRSTLATAIRESRTEMLPRLRPGDTVRVPRGAGREQRPPDRRGHAPPARSRTTRPRTSSRRSCAAAAPPSTRTRTRCRSSARAERASCASAVNLNKYFEKGDASSNPRLEPGDTVFIPARIPAADSSRSCATSAPSWR